MGSFELNLFPPIYCLNIDVGLGSIFAIIILTRDVLVFRGGSVGAILCYWSKNGLPISRACSGHTPIGLQRDWSTLPSHCNSLEVDRLDATAAGDMEDRKTGRQERFWCKPRSADGALGLISEQCLSPSGPLHDRTLILSDTSESLKIALRRI